jgi:hypothetical protein
MNCSYKKLLGLYLYVYASCLTSTFVRAASSTDTLSTRTELQDFDAFQDKYHEILANIATANETIRPKEIDVESDEGNGRVDARKFIRGYQSSYPAIYHPHCRSKPRSDAFTLWIRCPGRPDLDNKALSSHVCQIFLRIF